MLIVIDEAHNVCPREAPDTLTALATEHAIRIAGEGRKYGLHLLVCTQRPQKVHVNVLSQCDNLVLMRMGSEADLAYTGELMSFAPRDLLAGASGFGLGEALVAGKLASHPALIRSHLGSAQVARVIYGAIIGLALLVTFERHPPAAGVVIGSLIATGVAVAATATAWRVRSSVTSPSTRRPCSRA